MNAKGISPEERAAFVAGALMACDFAGLSVQDTTVVLKKMLFTPEEINLETLRSLERQGRRAQ